MIVKTAAFRRGCAVAAATVLSGLGAARAQSVEELRAFSINELANVTVTSVTKEPEALGAAPASIYVITHDEIVRSGLTRLPAILRLAPNLVVAQTSASDFTITPRGLNGSNAAQNFPNKLLVLIDGRTVYNPLFSGMYWDMQDVVPEDIDRIEVTSGPGGALWGANAFNGVINIITKKAFETQGGLLAASGGNGSAAGSIRYGGHINEETSYRVYLRATESGDSRAASGGSSLDHWRRVQGGFRLDWTPSGPNTVAVSGDAYYGEEAKLASFSGLNLLGRWTYIGPGGSTLQVQGYLDRVQRGHDFAGGAPFRIDTADVDVQQSLPIGSWNNLVFGGGARVFRYSIADAGGLLFRPNRRTRSVENLFAQDTISLRSDLKLIVGLKAESDAYSSVSLLPNLRLAWTAAPNVLVWTSASDAIRSPTPFDHDVREQIGTVLFIKGNTNFKPEKVRAYELGARYTLPPSLTLSATLFYNQYRDLRSLEPDPTTGLFPITWGNGIGGHAYGLEAWAEYQVTPWWRLTPGVRLLTERPKFQPGASGLLGLSQMGDDPRDSFSLRSAMDLGRRWRLDADFRRQGALSNPALPAYNELGGRLAFDLTKRIEVGLVAQNLLHARHVELPGGIALGRRFALQLRARF